MNWTELFGNVMRFFFEKNATFKSLLWFRAGETLAHAQFRFQFDLWTMRTITRPGSRSLHGGGYRVHDRALIDANINIGSPRHEAPTALRLSIRNGAKWGRDPTSGRYQLKSATIGIGIDAGLPGSGRHPQSRPSRPEHFFRNDRMNRIRQDLRKATTSFWK